MARLNTTFDATQHDTEQKDFENLPIGVYELEIEESEIKPTSKGDGTILNIKAKVLRPEEFEGRTIFSNYNLENRSTQAQEIGQRQFASLCRALELGQVDDTEELHFKAFTAKVGLGKPSKDGQYPARNEIKRYYYPDEGNVPEPEIDANQPVAPAAANDNKRQQTAANDNVSQPQEKRRAAGGRPWGSK